MKAVVLLPALAALSSGLTLRRNDNIPGFSSVSRLVQREEPKKPAPSLLSYDAWFGERTLGAAFLGWLNQDIISMPVRYERLKSELRPGSTRERMWYGPFNLPGINDKERPGSVGFLKMDPTSVQFNKRLFGFCKNCTVLSGKASLHFENATKAGVDSGVYIHHIVTLDGSKRNPGMPFYLCQEQKGFLGTFPLPGFIVSGNDEASNMFTTPDGTFNSGYRMTDDPKITMQAELVNYRQEKQQVYVVIDYEYVKTDTALVRPADSAVSLFSVTGCTPPDYHPKERVYNMTSAQVRVPNNGFIINAKGHLHDGGDYIVLKLNGKDICTSRAIYGKSNSDVKGHSHYTALDGPAVVGGNSTSWDVIVEMTQCTDPVPVRKGDFLSMASFVDGLKHPPRPTMKEGHTMEADEMGVFFINFATSNNTAAELKLTTGKAQLVSEKSSGSGGGVGFSCAAERTA